VSIVQISLLILGTVVWAATIVWLLPAADEKPREGSRETP
jgi:hypothetical protein